MKIKKTTLTITLVTLILILISTVMASNEVNPEEPSYEPNQNYKFSLNIDELNNTIIFKLSQGKIIILEKNKVDYDTEENSYLVNIDDLSAGEYNYVWQQHNETNTTNITDDSYNIEKAEPEIKLYLNSEENDTTITELETLNITAILETNQGGLEILINDEIKKATTNQEKKITLLQKFSEPGNYEIKARYNETQNYTSKEKTLDVEVEQALTIKTSKEKYDIGENAFYLINAPIDSEVEIEIWWNDTNNPGFETREKQETITIDDLDINAHNKLWKQIELEQTKKIGNYRLLARIKDTDITRTLGYEVMNSIEITITGETKIETKQETTLKVTTKGGILPYTYTWVLPDETTKTGDEVKIKYDDEGEREIKIIAKDKENNKKQETITLDVKEYHDLTIEVRDHENKVLKDAEIEITDLKEKKLTDSTGKAKFRIPKDEYRIRIIASGHSTRTENVELEKDTSLTIRLSKTETSTTTPTTNAPQIKLDRPNNEATLTTNEVEFGATISLNTAETCKLLVADKESAWMVEISRKENVKEENIVFKEKIDSGKYKWQITCGSEESEIRELIIKEATFSITGTDGTIDAGELRRQIENAHNNLDNLDLDARRAADALDIQETLRISLRDYERILRDINSLSLRRDLTSAQKEDKLQEYKELVQELEKSTPLLFELHESEEFVIYPDKEELEKIAQEYIEIRNIQGRVNKKELEKLQNMIRTRTYTAQATITYINGENEDIVLIHKNIEYTGETTRHHFIIEEIPESMNNNLLIKQTHDVLIRNKLIRFEKPETITYQAQGHQDLEDAKNAHTILLSESVFTSTTSGTRIPGFTGLVTITNTDIDTTTGLIIIIIIIILAYLFYAFDIKDKIKEKFTNLNQDKKMKELNMLINDAKDYLEAHNLERANFIYKEIKLVYQKAPRTVRNEIYKDITEVVKILNEKYIEHLITKTHEYQKNNQPKEAMKTYNKVTEVYNNTETDTQKIFKEQLLILKKATKNKQ